VFSSQVNVGGQILLFDNILQGPYNININIAMPVAVSALEVTGGLLFFSPGYPGYFMDKKKKTEEELVSEGDELLFPLTDAGDISFEDLFDIEYIQRLQDDFAKATNVASIITRVDGSPITKPSNFTRFCAEIVRKTEKGFANCCASDRAIGCFNPNGPSVQLCQSGGLLDAGTRIAVGGQHIANWMIGQVRDENRREADITAYAEEIGADGKELLAAYQEVPVMSHAQFSCVADMLFSLSQQLSKSAHQQLLQIRYIEKYRSLHDELLESEETLRQITSSAQDAIIMMDELGKVSFWNEAAEKIFGYSRDEILGQDLHSCLAPDAFMPRYAFALKTFRSTGYGRNLSKTQELTGVRKDGTVFPLELSLSAVIMHGKQHAIGIIRDITARKEAEAAEKKMAETLKHSQKMAAIGTLAGGIAHDFNNILSAILGFTELLEIQIDPESKAAKYINNITDAGMRAKTLVQQILAFSRQVKKDVQPVHVRAIIQEVLSLLRASLPTNIEIKVNAASDSLVMGDPSQIHQIIMNLCTNAAHAMRENGGTIDVSLCDMVHDPDQSGQFLSLSHGVYLKLVVADSGHGITPEIMERIFDPFFTTKDPGEGTGMGLSVVHGIVNSCNGNISVESEIGRGTTFTILLPVAEASVLPSKKAKSESVQGTGHILVVDDEEAIVEIITQMLGNCGYEVSATTSPEEALLRFAKNPEMFDLVLSDLTMPQLTGDKLAKEVMAIRPDIPVIICTGYNSALDEKKAQELGIKNVLLKPLTRKQLTENVRDVLRETRLGVGISAGLE